MTRTHKARTTDRPVEKKFTEDPAGWWNALMEAAESGELEDPDTLDAGGEGDR